MTSATACSYEELPLYLTVEEACKVLRIGRNLGYDFVRCGRLPSVRFGRNIRIPKSGLVEFVDQQVT